MSDVNIGEDAPILEVMSTMRAMRRLRSDPVPEELLTRLVEAATWAPSASNAQWPVARHAPADVLQRDGW
jgi:nitroreductase